MHLFRVALLAAGRSGSFIALAARDNRFIVCLADMAACTQDRLAPPAPRRLRSQARAIRYQIRT